MASRAMAAPPAAQVRRRDLGAIAGRSAYPLAIVLVFIFFLAPFFWMILNSFKTPIEVISLPPKLVFQPTLANYENVFASQQFGRYLVNSLVIGAGSVGLGLLLGVPAAFAIARWDQRRLATGILLARIVPGITFLVPLFIVFRQFKLVDTYASLILAHTLVGLPFIVTVMVPFFKAIPRELEEAARVDGASLLQTLRMVILPISGPGVVTASILAFVFSWNNFMFSVVLATNRTKTLPVAVYNFISYAQIDWGGLMAAAVVITVPVLILALITQRYIVRGLTAGAVKG